MVKTPPEELASYVTDELVTYLGSGRLNEFALTAAIDFSGLDIEGLDQLKQLHFVLSDDVVEFIHKLPERLRRVKSVSKQTSQLERGAVRGKIDWQETIQTRAKTGFDDRTVFVVDRPEVEYDIPENRVLKKLLAVIAEPLARDIEGTTQGWRAAWDDTDIVRLQRTLANNVYLDALPDPAEISLSGRDLETARRSRHRLYADSARLYRLYDDLLNDRLDRPAVQKLLQETLVVPTEPHRLFELCCVFGTIRRLQRAYGELTLQRVEPGMDELARLESDKHRIDVYYDQTGPLQFTESLPSVAELQDRGADEQFIRLARAGETHQEAMETFLGQSSERLLYSGRPDVLVLRYERDQKADGVLTDCVIGEAKYTESEATFSVGVRELLEYVTFARDESGYLEDSTVEITGVIYTDGVETTTDRGSGLRHLSTDAIFQEQ
ncbi:McrC family protein [Salinirubrum litoreum]|uniref:McrC family protein n=1 Tax=Salinirubrum litoreum TaxID=1126234 RepID=A0ABD5RB46_9EURY|nr:McrC family protein [Salinirubrum litoreum]